MDPVIRVGPVGGVVSDFRGVGGTDGRGRRCEREGV